VRYAEGGAAALADASHTPRCMHLNLIPCVKRSRFQEEKFSRGFAGIERKSRFVPLIQPSTIHQHPRMNPLLQTMTRRTHPPHSVGLEKLFAFRSGVDGGVMVDGWTTGPSGSPKGNELK
jgi:hypothetical protein